MKYHKSLNNKYEDYETFDDDEMEDIERHIKKTRKKARDIARKARRAFDENIESLYIEALNTPRTKE